MRLELRLISAQLPNESKLTKESDDIDLCVCSRYTPMPIRGTNCNAFANCIKIRFTFVIAYFDISWLLPAAPIKASQSLPDIYYVSRCYRNSWRRVPSMIERYP